MHFTAAGSDSISSKSKQEHWPDLAWLYCRRLAIEAMTQQMKELAKTMYLFNQRVAAALKIQVIQRFATALHTCFSAKDLHAGPSQVTVQLSW